MQGACIYFPPSNPFPPNIAGSTLFSSLRLLFTVCSSKTPPYYAFIAESSLPHVRGASLRRRSLCAQLQQSQLVHSVHGIAAIGRSQQQAGRALRRHHLSCLVGRLETKGRGPAPGGKGRAGHWHLLPPTLTLEGISRGSLAHLTGSRPHQPRGPVQRPRHCQQRAPRPLHQSHVWPGPGPLCVHCDGTQRGAHALPSAGYIRLACRSRARLGAVHLQLGSHCGGSSRGMQTGCSWD